MANGSKIGSMYFQVGGDLNPLEKSLDSAKKKTTDAGSKMQGAMDKAKGSVLALAAAGGVAAAGLFAMNKIMGEAVSLANIQEKEERKLEAVLKATGNAAGFSSQELKNLASQYQSVTTVGDETILSGMSIMATFKNVRKEGFERATMAAMDMSEVMGQDLNSSMTQLGKALNDPIKGLTSLSRVGVSFTDQQKDQIKVLQESGDIYGAQSIILDELESQFGGVAKSMADFQGGTLTQLGNTWGDVLEKIGHTETQNEDLTESYKKLNTTLEDQADNIAAIFSSYADGKTIVVNLATEIVDLADDVRMVGAAFEAFRDLTRATITVQQYFALEDADLENYGKVRKALAMIADTQRDLTVERSKWFKDEEEIKELEEQLAYQQQWYNEILADTSVEREKENDNLKRLGQLYTPVISAQKEHIETETTLSKVIKITTTDQYEAMKASKKRGDEAAKALQKEAQEAERATDAQGKAYRNMYSDLDEYSEDHYDLQTKLLDKEADAYRKLGVEESLVNRWRERQQEDLFDKYLLENGNFVDGVALGYKQMQRDQLTWADAGISTFNTFADGATSALSSNLFDVIKGDFDDLGAVWGGLWDSMLKAMTDILAQMAVEWAAAKVADFAVSYFHDGTLEIKDDEVPAILQMGEMVIPASTAQQIRDNLNSPGQADSDAFGQMAEEAAGFGLSSEALGAFGQNLADNISSQYGADMARGGIGVASGAPAGWAFDAISHPMTAINNLTAAAPMAMAQTAQQVGGFDTTAGNIGFTTAAIAAAALGLGAPAAAVAAIAGAIGVEALADAFDSRDFEGFFDSMEDSKGFFGSHFDGGILGSGHSVSDIMAAAGGWDSLGNALEDIGMDIADTSLEMAANPDDFNGGFGDDDPGGVEGIGADMGNPGSDMGNIGDDPGDMAARYGGIFSGPNQGYPVELHGTEAVIPLKNGTVPVDIRGADREGSDALLREVKALRQDLRSGQYQIAQNTGTSANIIKRWERNGIPEERVLA